MKNRLFAGILISLGGIVFLQFEGLLGSVLSSISFLAILYSEAELWTEEISRWDKIDWKWIGHTTSILALNLLAIWLMSFLFSEMKEASTFLVQEHLDYGYWFPRAVLCGLIIDISLWFGRSLGPLMIFLGTTLFMILGYPHILNEFFYISVGGVWTWQTIWYCVVVLLGNMVGANIRRVLSLRKP